MLDIVENFLKQYKILNSKYTYLVAFSGGADSLCLSDILCEISKKYDIKLAAMHVNHNWRRSEAYEEMIFCKTYCENNNIDFFVTTLDENIKHTELAAREERIKFFLSCAEQVENPVIFTGHTASDNMETLIYRLAKGTGIHGLQGILPVNFIENIPFYRPLITVSRQDTVSYCTNNNLEYNNDSSNENTEYKRNFIRHKVVPKLKEINENVETALNRLSILAQQNNDLISEYMSKVKSEICKQGAFDTNKFMTLSDATKQQLIYETVKDKIKDYDLKKISEIIGFITANANSKAGSRCSITNDLWLFVNNKSFYFINDLAGDKNASVKITNCGEYKFGKYIFSIQEVFEQPEKFPSDEEYTAFVDLSCFKDDFEFELRNRNDGDVITPLGMQGGQKLKKYLNSKSIPQHERNNTVLLCRNNEVFWVAGAGISNKIKTVQKPTHVIKLQKDS